MAIKKEITCDFTGEVLQRDEEILKEGFITVRGSFWINTPTGRVFLTDYSEEGAPTYSFVDEDAFADWLEMKREEKTNE